MALTLNATDEGLSRILEKVWKDDVVDQDELHAVMRISDGVTAFAQGLSALNSVQDYADRLVGAYESVAKEAEANVNAISQDDLQRIASAVEWQIAYVVVAGERWQRALLALANRANPPSAP